MPRRPLSGRLEARTPLFQVNRSKENHDAS
jgi:hypothetical protein